jgi:hypothetical protein
VPISLILFNEMLGTLVVETILPGIYSGILIAGSEVLRASLIGLVVPLASIVGIAMYVLCVYHPAKHAMFRRLEAKKVNWHRENYALLGISSKRATVINENGFIATFRKMKAFFTQVIKVSLYYLQTYVVRFSVNKLKERLDLRRSKENQWCNMNRCIHTYSAILMKGSPAPKKLMIMSQKIDDELDELDLRIVQDQCSSKTISSISSSNKNGSEAFSPPQEIISMLVSIKRKETFLKANNKFANILSKNPIIRSNSLRSILENKTKAVFYFNSQEALSMMRSHLFTSEFNSTSCVSVSALVREHESLWGFLYPDGVAITETERSEFVTLFNEWKNDAILSHDECVQLGITTDIDMILFRLFEDWFNDLFIKLSNKKTDRLIDQVLHTGSRIKKRVADMAATSPNNPCGIEFKAAMRALKCVEPKRLISPLRFRDHRQETRNDDDSENSLELD